jgi:hypothetical protein
VARVAGDSERQQLRGGLHRSVGRNPSRAVGGPLTRDRGAARGLPAARDRQDDLHHRPPGPHPDQPRQLEHGSVLPRPPERAPRPARPVLRLPPTSSSTPPGRRSCGRSGRRR